MARPSKFDEYRAGRILEALRNGHSRYAAAGFAGVDYGTLRGWLRAGEGAKGGELFQFFQRVALAEQEGIYRHETVIMRASAAGDVKTALEVVKRRRRDDWGDRQEITGADGGPFGIEVRAVNYRTAIAAIAAGSDSDSNAPGEN